MENVKKFKGLKLNLQLFAGDPPADPQDPPKVDPPADPPADPKKQPFAVFEDEKSFMSRVGREAKKQFNAQLAELGLTDLEALKQIVKNHADNEELSKTELQKAQDKIEKLEAEKAKTIEKANTKLIGAEARLLAGELGVKPDRLSAFIKLADLSEVKVGDDGSVSDTLKSALESVLTDFPEFKQVEKPKPPAQGGIDHSKGGTGTNTKLTIEDIKKMSSSEIQARIKEVREVMAQQPK